MAAGFLRPKLGFNLIVICLGSEDKDNGRRIEPLGKLQANFDKT